MRANKLSDPAARSGSRGSSSLAIGRQRVLDGAFGYPVVAGSGGAERLPVTGGERGLAVRGSVALAILPVMSRSYRRLTREKAGSTVSRLMRGSSAGESMSIQALAETIFRTARRPAMLFDLDLRVKIANRAFYETFQLKPDSLEEHLIDELNVAGWNGTWLRHHFEKIVWENTPLEDEPAELRIPDLGSRIFLLSARRIDGENQEPAALFVELEDVTQRESAREKAENHTTELERSNAELEQFAYIASHDLQEPLRMIASYTQLLGQRYSGKLDTDANEFIGFVVDGVHRMQSLIDALLAYSRIARRGGRFQQVRCDEALAFVQADLKQVISESKAMITSDPLPIITADSKQIGQLFQNLLSNAMKFRAPGVSPRIHISASRKNGQWLFSFDDNGIGIPLDQRKRLFQLFHRLHTRAEYSGTGIGLALCKKIVERHGGRIWLESEPNEGCTFLFTLPAESDERKRE
jgi:signal transduction histidine kinase